MAYTFYIQGFEKLAVALKNKGCPEFTVMNIYLLLFRIFEELALALKNTVVLEIFAVLKYVLSFRIFSNLRLPWKTELPWNFSLYWICIFYRSGFLSNLFLPWKTEFPWYFSLYWNIFLSFRIFEQLALALKTEFALKFFASPRPPASYAYDQKSIINSFKNCSISNMTTVADTFWSVHIKCFHQKKIKSKRPTKGTGPAERQHKGREQLSTKNVTSKTSRLHSVIKRHKVSNRSGWNPKINCIQTKSNEIWFRKAKSEERRKETSRTEEDLKRWCHGKVQKTLHEWGNQKSWLKTP